MTQLRRAWDDQDLRDRDRRSKIFGKVRTVHFAEADTEWHVERIAHGISGVTWSFDPDESIWWCGVLDPSIPEPDVVDWSEDWSNYESSPLAENVFPEKSQALALISEDVSSPNVRNKPRCWQLRLIEHWLRLDHRLHQRNKIAMVSFLVPTLPAAPRAKAMASSRENRKIHRVSSVAEVIISGDSVLNDTRKDLAKEVKMDLVRSTWEPHGV